jgi:hypothetical protein
MPMFTGAKSLALLTARPVIWRGDVADKRHRSFGSAESSLVCQAYPDRAGLGHIEVKKRIGGESTFDGIDGSQDSRVIDEGDIRVADLLICADERQWDLDLAAARLAARFKNQAA